MTTTNKKFAGNFTQQEPIADDAIAAAVAVMQSGRLHRYNVSENNELSETTLLEIEYAKYQGQQYCLACTSGGYAMQTALRAWGIEPAQPILTNAFTLSPVPGAITAAGGTPVLIDSTDQLVLDLDHLEQTIISTGASVLMLSHMRGHLVDMDKIMVILNEHKVALIEDCAHTMGATFNGVKSGNHGVMACFSTQTYKHINSGEGGFLTSNDEVLMAKAVILSGSYMLYERHEASPASEVFEQVKYMTPNCSGRMDNLRAAILRPQLVNLDANCQRWNVRYEALAAKLATVDIIDVPQEHQSAVEVHSSAQFAINSFSEDQNQAFLNACKDAGVELKWFGADKPAAYTSRYDSWQYFPTTLLPQTDKVLARLYDVRIPLTFSIEDCATIGEIVAAQALSNAST
ncbi:MAG: aminotransferase class I/II-fold pyridoxal phosphate-dependent enzyme [Granulosicoccaceae bacterium]